MTEGAATEKTPYPLHVLVAEALGCAPVSGEGCAELPNMEHHHCPCWSGKHRGSNGCVYALAEYDTDWTVTGPLLEKYVVATGRYADKALPEPFWAYWQPADNDLEIDARKANATGETMLIAVCNLILALDTAGKLVK